MKLKIPSEDEIFNVDPTRFALVSPLTKGRILLHKLQARVHGCYFNKFDKKQKPPKSEAFVLVSGEPQFIRLCLLKPLYQAHKFCQ